MLLVVARDYQKSTMLEETSMVIAKAKGSEGESTALAHACPAALAPLLETGGAPVALWSFF